MSQRPNAALIVAAGRGTRFGGEIPKQYVPLHGICAFRRSIERFLGMEAIHLVQPVIHVDDRALFAEAMAGLDDPRLLPAVTGGATRSESVRKGLQAMADDPPDCVLVHDAARPFVTEGIIGDVLKALERSEAAFAALPVVDALWRVEDGMASEPVSRTGLWRAQTPQGFHFAPLLQAHLANTVDAADDVEIARAAGMSVRVVEGSTENFKITTPQDLARAERLLE